MEPFRRFANQCHNSDSWGIMAFMLRLGWYCRNQTQKKEKIARDKAGLFLSCLVCINRQKLPNQGMEVDWEKRGDFLLLPKSSQSHLFYCFQGCSKPSQPLMPADKWTAPRSTYRAGLFKQRRGQVPRKALHLSTALKPTAILDLRRKYKTISFSALRFSRLNSPARYV